VDAEGYIFIRGRSDFVIKHRGFRLHPAEVEDAACTHSGIASAACVKDEPRDQLCLFVVGADRDEQALRHTLCRLLEPAKVPDRILVLPELPKTANQKTDRKALRALLNA
jgi:mycobactin phenyloxazoline synthetase